MRVKVILLFLLLLSLIACSNSESNKVSEVTSLPQGNTNKVAELETVIERLNVELKEYEDQVAYLQGELVVKNSKADLLTMLQANEIELFKVAKRLSKYLPFLNDYEDPVSKEILESIDFNSLSDSENQLILYAAIESDESGAVDTTQPINVELLAYRYSENLETAFAVHKQSLTVEKKQGKWIVTNYANGEN